MENLKKVEQELEEIKEKIENASEEELNTLQNVLEHKIKYLLGTKNYYVKQKTNKIALIKELLQEAKNIEKIISEKRSSSAPKKKQEPKKIPKEPTIRKEEIELKQIMDLELDPLEKIEIIKRKTEKIKKHIDYLRRELKRQKALKKEFDDPKNRQERTTSLIIQELNRKNKVLMAEITYQTDLLSIYENLKSLLTVKNKNNSAVQKEEKITLEKENKAYYLIIYSLLEEDKNYLFLKEIIENNPNFINARYDRHPILFDILDRYIENIKLELQNQKIVHKNPNYYYALLKLFRNPLLVLSEEEEKYFKSRLEELKTYVEQKKYVRSAGIKEKIDKLFILETERNNANSIKINRKNEQEFFNSFANVSQERANLTREYLERINGFVSKFQSLFVKENGEFPSDEQMAQILKVPVQDIRNSSIVLETLAFESEKYAVSLGYSKNYESYVRFHVLDTACLYEESPSLKNIEENKTKASKEIKKALKFRQGNVYPVITYQFKLENRKKSNFKIFESTIKVDRVIANNELNEYRNDTYLKNIIGNIIQLRNSYNLEPVLLGGNNLENAIDELINLELKKQIEKNALPVLYFTELEMEEKDKIELHYQICHYLMRVSKLEATTIFKKLKKLAVSRYYSFIPIEESKIEIDTKCFIGYLNSHLVKCSIHGVLGGEKIELYKEMLETAQKELDQEDLFTDYFNKRKLIRSIKKSETEEKRTMKMETRKRERIEARNRTF